MSVLIQYEEREANIRGIMLYAQLGNVRGVNRYEKRQQLAAQYLESLGLAVDDALVGELCEMANNCMRDNIEGGLTFKRWWLGKYRLLVGITNAGGFHADH
jgi:hypothetical protein